MKLNSFKISQALPVSSRKAYAAWTNPAIAKKYTTPDGCTRISFKARFKVGGQYASAMKTPKGVMKNSGEYLAIEPGRRIVQTFVWQASDTEMNVIQIEFKDRRHGSVITMTGMGFALKDEAVGNSYGWKSSLKTFAGYFT